MQFPQAVGRTQLPLFHGAILSNQAESLLFDATESPRTESPESFSELGLSGSMDNCLLLLAPILRELSQQAGDRWLTLVDAPSQLSQSWLRQSKINRERILLLQTRGSQTAIDLACEALRLGRSHTVISWIDLLDRQARQRLTSAANQGQTQSLNIHLS